MKPRMLDTPSGRKCREKRVSRVESAYRELKRRITENVYPPNHHILIGELAVELGMSVTPIRESLIALEKDGLIELIARRGMRVLPLTIRDMEEIYDTLTCLETHGAGLVAARRLSEDELLPLAETLEEMEEALEIPDLDRWADADERFHRTMISLCGNSRIAKLANANWDQIRRARHLSLRLVPLPHRSNEEHRALLEAFRSGDVAVAQRVHHAQRIRASENIVGVLRRFHLFEI